MKYKLIAAYAINISKDNKTPVVIPQCTELTAFGDIAQYNGVVFDWTEYRSMFVAECLEVPGGLQVDDLQAEPGQTYEGKNLYRKVMVADAAADTALADASLAFSETEPAGKLVSMNVAGCQQETIDALVNVFKNSGFANAAYDDATSTIVMDPVDDGGDGGDQQTDAE